MPISAREFLQSITTGLLTPEQCESIEVETDLEEAPEIFEELQKVKNNFQLRIFISMLPDWFPEIFKSSNIAGETAEINPFLKLAIKYKNYLAISRLVKEEANCTIEDYQKILFLAAKEGCPDIVKMIIHRESILANVADEKNGNTALHIAVLEFIEYIDELGEEFGDFDSYEDVSVLDEGKYLEIINSLVKHARLTAVNRRGETVTDIFNKRINRFKQDYRVKYENESVLLKKLENLFNNLFEYDSDIDQIDRLLPLSKSTLSNHDNIKQMLAYIRKKIILEYKYLEYPIDEDVEDKHVFNAYSLIDNLISKRLISKVTMDIMSIIKNALQKVGWKWYLWDDILDITHTSPIHCYAYIERRGWIAISGKTHEERVLSILTLLLEHARRHPWEKDECLMWRKALDTIAPGKHYLTKGKDALYLELEQLETKYGYRGADLSDDSDEENISNYRGRKRGENAAIKAHTEKMVDRSQVANFFVKKTGALKHFYVAKQKTNDKKTSADSKKEAQDKIKTVLSSIKLEDRAQIIHDEARLPTQVINDLQLLNDLQRKGKLNENTVKMIDTKFFIAQYRGIHYNTDTWEADARRQHRKLDVTKIPTFSRAVFAMSGHSETVDSAKLESSPDLLSQLTMNASILDDQIRYIKAMGPINCYNKKMQAKKKRKTNDSNNNEKTYLFDNPLDAIQELYTKDYSAFHDRLQEVYDKKKNAALLDDPLSIALLFSQGDKNITLSTADTPYHALRYAYGIKFYSPDQQQEKKFDSQEHNRLRPRWRGENGQAERPYSGMVCTWLMSPLDFEALQANHLVSMNNEGRVRVNSRIISERETTIWSSMIPAGKIISQHIARYPSFHHDEYSELFYAKYGLTEHMYEEYRRNIVNNMPHTTENQLAKQLLGEHLCAYHEAQLIEDARLAAQDNQGWLIYKDMHGGFSLVPPRLYPKPKTTRNDLTQQEQAAQHQRAYIKNARDKRINQEQPPSWIVNLCSNYQVQVGINMAHVLSKMLEKPESEITALLSSLTEVFPAIKDGIHFKLRKIAEHYQCVFVLKSPMDEEDVVISPANLKKSKSNTYELVYLGGEAVYGLIPNLVPTSNLLPSSFFKRPLPPPAQSSSSTSHLAKRVRRG